MALELESLRSAVTTLEEGQERWSDPARLEGLDRLTRRTLRAAAKFSDLDLVVVARERLDWRRLGRLSTAMVESDLPIRVDVLDWHAISPAFRRLIEGQCVVLQRAGAGTPRTPGPTEGATEPVG